MIREYSIIFVVDDRHMEVEAVPRWSVAEL